MDYADVVALAERDADVMIWDGGNNAFPFLRSGLQIVVLDPHRAGHELRYHPGETNLRMADVVVINKVDTATPDDVMTVRANAARGNPDAVIVEAASPVTVDEPGVIRGGRGRGGGRGARAAGGGPTLPPGGMAFGAATLAARNHGAKALVDPRPHAVGSIRGVFERYPHLGPVLPAMGYGPEQVHELQTTIERAGADVVVIGTPVDLRRIMTLRTPAVRVRYELEERTRPDLEDIVREWRQRR